MGVCSLYILFYLYSISILLLSLLASDPTDFEAVSIPHNITQEESLELLMQHSEAGQDHSEGDESEAIATRAPSAAFGEIFEQKVVMGIIFL
jgi:hypothetical protein